MRDDLPYLEALARRFPTRDAALAEIAHLEAVLTLPKGTVHVVSDVHGEHKKLSHVIRNASGALRVLVDRLFADLSADERRLTLSCVYYCERTWTHLGLDAQDPGAVAAFLYPMLDRLLVLARTLSKTWSDRAVDRVLPRPFQELFRELLWGNAREAGADYRRALVQPLIRRGRAKDVLRLASRLVRNLSVFELVVAGDLGDRGPRLDKVIDVLKKQPRLAIAWGNHDACWMGACLGQEALICTVVRISLRYGRTAQLEEGYAIPLEPVEKLARDVYGSDPAAGFRARISDGTSRDPLMLARLQKAICVLQLKLEGQVIARNPAFGMEHRRVLRGVDLETRTVALPPGQGTRRHPLLDAHLPTVDPRDPERLSPEEERCLAALKTSFCASTALWEHMQLVRAKGAMLLRRDHNLIFHGCLPVDEAGAFLPFAIDPEDPTPRAGGELLAAADRVVHRAFREKRAEDLDRLWYLWTGPLSPLFGKDKMATFESHFVADPAERHETKNPYFQRVHDEAFCRRVFEALGADPAVGFIVNGHVPVKLEKGEQPLKGSKMAVTIDGAFSEAYGDRGFTLVLEAERTALAEHHHFESVDDAVQAGADIVPKVVELRAFPTPRRVGQTEAGAAIAREIEALEALVRAFDENRVAEA
jgi:fructose-1,6-bisphosphatase-3